MYKNLNLIKLAFWKQVLLAFVIGTTIGVVAPTISVELKPLGDMFIALIKMLVAPLIFCAIVTSTTSMDDTSALKRLAGKTLFMFMFTATLASFIGLTIGTLWDFSSAIQLEATSVKERDIPGFTQVLLNMIPVNPFAALSEGKVLQIIVFAAFVGVAINVVGEKAQPLKNAINAGTEVMFAITRMVLKLTPLGVLGLMAWVVGHYGLATLMPLGKFIAAIYVACIIHIVFIYGGMIHFFTNISATSFFKKIFPAQIVAFTTCSSFGSLPASTKVCNENLKISPKYTSFILPLGATMNMDGCGGIYPAIAAIFIASLYGIDLTTTQYIIIAFTATISSIGTAGVPGSAMVMLTVTLGAANLPMEGIAFIAAIDRIIDMIRTATNVTGDMMTATVVAQSEEKHG